LASHTLPEPPRTRWEIERKFLTSSDAWRSGEPGERMVQGYLSNHGSASVVRVRSGSSGAFLAIKGRGKVQRAEYEYPIPRAEADELLEQLVHRPLIEKTRYRRPHQDHVWEVDEFGGANAGLVVAEVELAALDDQPALPAWLGREVTDDPRYTNSALSDRPFSTWSAPPTDLIERALAFAARAHAEQTRKGTRIPYVTHPVRVAATLLAAGCDTSIAAAAYLHDTLEDTPTTHADLRAEFGDEVADLVAGASEPDNGATWEVRKQHTIDALPGMRRRALWVPLADKIDNAESILADLETAGATGRAAVWGRFSRPVAQQAWYYRSVLAALQMAAAVAPVDEAFALLVERLARVVGKLFAEVESRPV
jgi:adenylate cyclase